ncbi:MAG TPA: hypothetical protein VMD74_05275, partial [Candidatus Methylomirabilis sp.]|nr:hypothetical protein [Candidatus Methylomirabilis sp.]
MIIDGNGYVGIGVSPSNAKLEVEGGAGPSNIAIYGHGSGSNGTGVYGNGNGGSYGVRGIGGPDGVEGEGTTNGVEGNGATNGIQGGGAVVGVHGYNESCLMGSCYMEGPSSIGVYGESDWGVGVKARGTTYDFYGASSNPSYFTGPVSTGGALTSGGALTAGGVLHLAQIPDSSAGTCNSANAGSMYYSTNYYTICYCRGGQWCNMVSGSCGDSTHCHS